jgi:hypothetical protein
VLEVEGEKNEDMGAFYTNVMLCGPKQKEVAQFMTQANRLAYVSPTVGKFTVVYDQETENQDETTVLALASQLSEAFECAVLAVLVHDSDIFAYWLFEEGELIDKYNSMPGYFENLELPPLGGDPRKLCAALGAENAVDGVTRVFQKVASRSEGDWSANYLFAEDIHRDLAGLLGIPPFVVGTGYCYIERDQIPEEFNEVALVKCP